MLRRAALKKKKQTSGQDFICERFLQQSSVKWLRVLVVQQQGVFMSLVLGCHLLPYKLLECGPLPARSPDIAMYLACYALLFSSIIHVSVLKDECTGEGADSKKFFVS